MLRIRHEGKGVIVGVGELVLQVGEDRMLILTVHLTLLGKVKGRLEAISGTDILEAVQDFLILTVLLMSKLVAREAENYKASRKAALQLVELGVVPDGCASEGGHILYEHGPASEGIEIYLLPIQADGTEVVKGLGNVSHGASQQSSRPLSIILIL